MEITDILVSTFTLFGAFAVAELTEVYVSAFALIGAVALVVILKITSKFERKSEALELIRIAVNAAEQVMKSETGSRKKQAVLDWLDTKGVKLDPDIVDKAIEAEVAKLKKGIEGSKGDENGVQDHQ